MATTPQPCSRCHRPRSPWRLREVRSHGYVCTRCWFSLQRGHVVRRWRR